MIQTKHLFIAVAGTIGLVVVLGIESLVSNTNPLSASAYAGVQFNEPKDAYFVVSDDSGSKESQRDAFISKINEALSDDPLPPAVEPEEVMPAPQNRAISEPKVNDTVEATTTVDTGTPDAPLLTQ